MSNQRQEMLFRLGELPSGAVVEIVKAAQRGVPLGELFENWEPVAGEINRLLGGAAMDRMHGDIADFQPERRRWFQGE